jgi:hypothetical protein
LSDDAKAILFIGGLIALFVGGGVAGIWQFLFGGGWAGVGIGFGVIVGSWLLYRHHKRQETAAENRRRAEEAAHYRELEAIGWTCDECGAVLEADEATGRMWCPSCKRSYPPRGGTLRIE